MVGDDACSVCVSLIQKLLEFIMNVERNRQYSKGEKPPKQPKIKTGKISKKQFSKLQKNGVSFDYLPVQKDLMPQFEEAMKQMGGTFFTGGIEDNNNIYVAIPTSQKNLASLAAQHMLAKEIEKQPDSFIIRDGNSKLSEEEMGVTSDVMNSYDIPMFAFRTDDGKYMTIVPKDYEGQYEKAMSEVGERTKELKNIEVTRYDQTSQLEKPSHAALVVSEDEAKDLAAIAKSKDLDIKFSKVDKGVAVLFEMDIFDEIQAAKDQYNAMTKEVDDYLIDITDDSISMDIDKLVIDELSDEESYFVRVPNTAGKDYIRLDKEDVEIINSGKSLKTMLDMEKTYPIYDSTGALKQERSGEELAKSYNTRHPHAKKDTEVFEHGQGKERINLFNKEKNQIISMKLDSAENIRTLLKEHEITGKTADLMLADINSKLNEKQKEIFNYSAEKTEIVYADIPNIGEYLAQSQLSQAIVGKVNMSAESPKEKGAMCCVMDHNTDSYAVIPVLPLKEVQAKLSQMGYSEMSAKEIAEKIVRSYREGDVKEKAPEIDNTLKVTPFSEKNAELADCGYCKGKDSMMLVRESEDTYKYMSIDKGSSLADIEKALSDKFDVRDDLSQAVVMKQLIQDDIVRTAEPKTFDGDVKVSQVTSKYIEVAHEGKAEMMPRDNLDIAKLKILGVSEKTMGDIRKSFEKSENEVLHPEKQNLSGLILNAAAQLGEKIKEGSGKLVENLKPKGQER